MTNGTKALIGTVPTFQAAALVGESVKFAKKKQKNPLDFGKEALKVIVGTTLIKETAKQISLV